MKYTYTLIGPNGETVLPFRVGDLQDGGKYGHAAASISDAAGRKRFGIVANNGKVILPFEYDHIASFFGVGCGEQPLAGERHGNKGRAKFQLRHLPAGRVAFSAPACSFLPAFGSAADECFLFCLAPGTHVQ